MYIRIFFHAINFFRATLFSRKMIVLLLFVSFHDAKIVQAGHIYLRCGEWFAYTTQATFANYLCHLICYSIRWLLSCYTSRGKSKNIVWHAGDALWPGALEYCIFMTIPCLNVLPRSSIPTPHVPQGHCKQHHQTSNISRTLIGNEIVDPSDVVGASPVGAAPTTSSFST